MQSPQTSLPTPEQACVRSGRGARPHSRHPYFANTDIITTARESVSHPFPRALLAFTLLPGNSSIQKPRYHPRQLPRPHSSHQTHRPVTSLYLLKASSPTRPLPTPSQPGVPSWVSWLLTGLLLLHLPVPPLLPFSITTARQPLQNLNLIMSPDASLEPLWMKIEILNRPRRPCINRLTPHLQLPLALECALPSLPGTSPNTLPILLVTPAHP